MNTRKQVRLQNYNYSENGAYFITICTKDKKQTLGNIVEDGNVTLHPNREEKFYKKETLRFRPQPLCDIVGDGILDVPPSNVIYKDNVYVILSEFGKIVKHSIEYLHQHNNNIDVEKYVIMPNHIHLIITIHSAQGTSGKPSPTINIINTRQNEIIPKFVSALKRFTNKQCDTDLWQRSYTDHVIRNNQDYLNHVEYIENNPLKWELDKYYVVI